MSIWIKSSATMVFLMFLKALYNNFFFNERKYFIKSFLKVNHKYTYL